MIERRQMLCSWARDERNSSLSESWYRAKQKRRQWPVRAVATAFALSQGALI